MTLNHSSRPRGISGNAIRTWGYLFLILGIAGTCILQNHFLGMNTLNAQELLEVLNRDPSNMGIATGALLFQALETCAVPLYTFLLVEGFTHTSNAVNYLVRLIGVAAVSEIPYNLAMSGNWIDLSSRNPVWGMALCLLMLILYVRYGQKGIKNTALKICLTLAAFVWMKILEIEDGMCLLMMTGAYWLMRSKPSFRIMAAMGAAGLCVMFSPFYLAAPMSVLILHFYNGEPGPQNRLINYAAYPVTLLCIGIGAMFL